MSFDYDGDPLSTEQLIDEIREDMLGMEDSERIDLMNRLMDGYCKHCGTRCLPCSCQAFWMEH